MWRPHRYGSKTMLLVKSQCWLQTRVRQQHESLRSRCARKLDRPFHEQIPVPTSSRNRTDSHLGQFVELAVTANNRASTKHLILYGHEENLPAWFHDGSEGIVEDDEVRLFNDEIALNPLAVQRSEVACEIRTKGNYLRCWKTHISVRAPSCVDISSSSALPRHTGLAQSRRSILIAENNSVLYVPRIQSP